MTFKVLVSDKIAADGVKILKSAGFVVDEKTGLDEAAIIQIIPEYDAMIVRSQTRVTAPIINASKKLKVIGRAGVGTDNIDVAAATKKGVIVLNSPEGNTIAAAEHTFAMMLALARNIPNAVATMREGKWDRQKFVGSELYGKTLGVIGLGKIGSRVAGYGLAFGMTVVGYDPFASEEFATKLGVALKSVDEILQTSDFVTVHVPKNKDTENLINLQNMQKMKVGARLINCARGGIISEKDLEQAIQKGFVAGAAFDVFNEEPALNHPLSKLPQVITTPHLGASTEEAQVNVALDVAAQIVEVLLGGDAKAAVNIPAMNPKWLGQVKKYFVLAEKVASLAGQLAQEAILEVRVEYSGEIAKKEIAPLTVAIQKSLLEAEGIEGVNYVNAPLLLTEKGMKWVDSKVESMIDFSNLITVTLKTAKGTRQVAGTYFEGVGERIVSIDGFKLNLEPQGLLLIVPNIDKPGIVGEIGTLLAQNKINIASMIVGRESIGGNAVTVISVDNDVPKMVLDQISKFGLVRDAVRLVKL